MSLEEIHEKCIPPYCLPKEYGGELPTCDELNHQTVQQFCELKHFFDAEELLINSYTANK